MDEGIRMADADISGSTEQRAEEQNGKGENVEEGNWASISVFWQFCDYLVRGTSDTFRTVMKGSLNNS